MELEKFDRQLMLLVTLTNNDNQTAEDIAAQMHISRRSVYRYIEAFKKMGFVINKSGTVYSISPDSPFFRKITERVYFSADEAYTINQILNQVVDNSSEVRHLREKLSRHYEVNVLERHGLDETVARNLATMFRAAREERMCILHNYRSGNSRKVSDRIVEPYLFMNGNSEARCYEISSGLNKTFKLARVESVTLLDAYWGYKERHRNYYTDFFHFSGEERFRVQLKMGYLAMSCLVEEYPASAGSVQQLDDKHYLLDTDVCSPKGVGRFVLGLWDDIEVIDSPELMEFLAEHVRMMQGKLSGEAPKEE